MSNRLTCLLATLILFGLTAAAQADTIIAATGSDATAGYDNQWKTAFLGSLEIGTGDATHNGTQIGGTFQNAGTDATGTVHYNSNDTFAVDLLVAAYDAAKTQNTFTQAFVYDNNQWPLGGADTAWANLTENNPGTHWIGAQDNLNNIGDQEGYVTHDPGYYAYEIAFETSADNMYSYLTGSFATDNELIAILLNGNEIDWDFTGMPDKKGTTFDIGGFFTIDGKLINFGDDYTLTFIVSNYGSAGNVGNPTGLWVGEIQLTDDPAGTPEPGTLLILGIAGAIGIPVSRRWKKNGK